MRRAAAFLTALAAIMLFTAGISTYPPIFGSTVNGLVSASGGGTANFLRADGTWAAPSTVTGANPTGTASDTAVNGVAGTFMRSDAAPAVQKCSLANFGLCKPDGATITVSNGVISSATGYSTGTLPTVVQVAFSVNGGNSAVFGVAPTNGNYLVAMCFNPNSQTAGAGWAVQVVNTTGTDFGTIITKTAGAGESTTQTPMSSVGAAGGIVIWEINGQNGSTPFVYGVSQAEQSSGTLSNVPVLLPNVTNMIGLAALSVVTTPTIVGAFNLGVQDVLDNSGSRKLAAGHTNISLSPMAGVVATISTISASTKGSTAWISS